MSHFSVMVIGDNVDEQLAPYQENNMGDCPEQFLKFNDCEDEHLNEWKNGHRSMAVNSITGERISRYDDRFEVRTPSGAFSKRTHVIPDDSEWKLVDVPFSEMYSTFDGFMKEYHYTERDPKTNRYGRWENPNAKWDWYAEGGRWAGFLPLKDGGTADSALLGDIEFEGKINTTRELYGRVYDVIMSEVGHTPVHTPWSEYLIRGDDEVEKITDTIPSGHKRIDAINDIWDRLRYEYHCQPRVEAFADLYKKYAKITIADEKGDSFDSTVLYASRDADNFIMPREQYIDYKGDNSISTFAILKDGKWFERGTMHMFACISDEKDHETWHSIYKNVLMTLSPDTRITIIDCHI